MSSRFSLRNPGLRDCHHEYDHHYQNHRNGHHYFFRFPFHAFLPRHCLNSSISDKGAALKMFFFYDFGDGGGDGDGDDGDDDKGTAL